MRSALEKRASTERRERAKSLICGCNLISANWLIGALDTDDTTMHADIRARGKTRERRLGEKRYDRYLQRICACYNLPRGFSRETLVFVLDYARPLYSDSFFFFSVFISFTLPLLLIFFVLISLCHVVEFSRSVFTFLIFCIYLFSFHDSFILSCPPPLFFLSVHRYH